ncbi:hypothetical protein MMC25_005171 [Agyrium rufum]|nr:hypothetical protein [Agyrium rufum]
MADRNQVLGSKERTLFQQLIKNYENKQYKKGIKVAEQILRKHSNHGDTQAMKALIINAQGHTEEAFALGKEALKNDMKSHVCWHVYGLLYRQIKDFEESIKAYKFALKLDPENKQIQRDLALLQIQTRDFEGYQQSRRAMLDSQSNLRTNWTALAIAQHLAGNLEEAEKTLTVAEDIFKSGSKTDQESQEIAMYKNTIIAERGEYEKALEHLAVIGKKYPDRTAVLEMRASYLLKLERFEAAEKAYRTVLDRNPDYRAYYEGLQSATKLDMKDSQAVKSFYDDLAKKYPKADAAKRIPLDLLSGSGFKEAADQYLQFMFRKGVPSTFANIKRLYSDPEKLKLMQELAEGHVEEKGDAETGGDKAQFNTFANYFLAQHYNYHLSRDLDKAMEYIEKALKGDPKSVEFTMTKARIFKHYGDISKASEVMAEARWLDDRDRYANTRSAKYQLRNDENEAAITTMSKWTRNEAVGGPLGDLHDMQCTWYLTEDGESYARQGKLGLALKRFHAVNTIFETYKEDEFDFHRYSLTKNQIRAYIELIRWEDNVRDTPMYTRAGLSAIKTYLLLHDHPESAKPPTANGVNGHANGDPAESKKGQKKAKKAQQEQQEAEKAKAAAKANATATTPAKVDEDPQGQKLADTTEPLKDAMKFLTPMLESCPEDVEVQNAGFEVYFRRSEFLTTCLPLIRPISIWTMASSLSFIVANPESLPSTEKYLLALRCLLAAHALSPSDPTTHAQTIQLASALTSEFTSSASLPPKTRSVIDEQLPSLFPSPSDLKDLKAFNDAYLSEHGPSLPHVRAALKARYLLDKGSKGAAEEKLKEMVEKEESSTLEDALAGLELVREIGGDLGAYKEVARGRWGRATAFK